MDTNVRETMYMRELIDNMYLFSLSSDSFGEIVAQRTRESFSFEGKNIFKHLGVVQSELRFLNNTCGDINMPTVIAGVRNGETRLILFDISSSREISLGIAMEFSKPTEAVMQAYVGREGLISPRAREVLNTSNDMQYDVAGDMAASLSVACMSALGCEIGAVAERDTVSLFRDILSSVAELVCVPIECTFDCNAVNFGNGASLLHANACAFVALTMAMAAREHARDRMLRVLVSKREGFVSVSLGFECGDRAWQGESLFCKLISDRGLICNLGERDGRVICGMAPCYVDEGLQGVKENMTALQMLEFWK